ncbi:MAG TPA: alpha/beta hydrolase [Trichormus sp.]|jgi:hypothetical protein
MFDIAATVGFSALASVIAYLGLSPRIAELLYLPVMFEPHKFPIGDWSMSWLPQGQTCSDIWFPTANGAKLHGWYFPVADAEKTLLVNHGNTGNIADLHVLISLLIQTDANVFVYDYRGYGKSESRSTTKSICEDGLAAYDWLASEHSGMPIILYGESLGGAVACHVAEHRSPSGVIVQSSFFEMRRIAKETYAIFGIWPESLFQRPYLSNARVLATLECPVLLVHGSKDPEVHPAHAHDLFRVAKSATQLVILPNTAHSEIDQSDGELFVARLQEFITHSEVAPQAKLETPSLVSPQITRH